MSAGQRWPQAGPSLLTISVWMRPWRAVDLANVPKGGWACWPGTIVMLDSGQWPSRVFSDSTAFIAAASFAKQTMNSSILSFQVHCKLALWFHCSATSIAMESC
jgi:hypothetical protein